MPRPAESWTDLEAYLFPPPDGPRRCAWPSCGAPFDPARNVSRFCCGDCREAAKNWRKANASALLDPLLVWITHRSRTDPHGKAKAAAARRFVFDRARDLLDDLARMPLNRPDVASASRLNDPQTAANRLADLGLNNRAICRALDITPQKLAALRAPQKETTNAI